MIEILHKWVIVSAGQPCGSFISKADAEYYAEALRALRKIDCVVKDRDEVV